MRATHAWVGVVTGLLLAPSIACAETAPAGSWRPLAPPPEARDLAVGAVLPGGVVLVAGGSNGEEALASSEIYDPSTRVWSSGAPLREARQEAVSAVLPGGEVLVSGGSNGKQALASSEIYRPALGVWRPGRALPEARAGAVAARLPDGSVLVTGGSNASGVLASSELYDPLRRRWRGAPAMPEARTNAVAASLANGDVLVTGGSDGTESLSSSEIYDPATGTWSGAAAMLQARPGASASTLPDGDVLVAGGPFYVASEIYDPTANTWSDATSLPVTAAHAYAVAASLPGGDVLLAGGTGTWPGGGGIGPDGPLSATLIYEPSSKQWNEGPAMLDASPSIAASLPGGDVLFVGAYPTSYHVAQGDAEIYDPGAQTWRTTSAPGCCRGDEGMAAPLPGGKVLVTGGREFGFIGPTNASEIYDSATQTWSAAAELPGECCQAVAASLPGGDVLVTGGWFRGGPQPLGRAAIYDPKTNSWSEGTPAPIGRASAFGAPLPGGDVLVAGGDSYPELLGPEINLTSAETYDPGTGSWSSAPSIPEARLHGIAASLGNGDVLVTGGQNGARDGAFELLGSSLLYDPRAKSWLSAAALPGRRIARVAASLPDGDVLVLGGFRGERSAASAEIFSLRQLGHRGHRP